MEHNYGKIITAFLAVMIGVFAIISFVPNIELAIGFMSITFGIVAIIWASRARNSLSPGTSLREYTTYFLWSLILIMFFSVWDLLINIFQWEGFLLYPKYFFISIAYLVFFYTSYKILYIGKQFGIQSQVARMDLSKKVIQKNKSNKSRKKKKS